MQGQVLDVFFDDGSFERIPLPGVELEVIVFGKTASPKARLNHPQILSPNDYCSISNITYLFELFVELISYL